MTFTSAAGALDAVRWWKPDVLVSDVEMPEVDGYALIQRLRSLPASEWGKTPAVALTAYGRVEDRMRSLAAGFHMHVEKPVDPAELTIVIANLVGQGFSWRPVSSRLRGTAPGRPGARVDRHVVADVERPQRRAPLEHVSQLRVVVDHDDRAGAPGQ